MTRTELLALADRVEKEPPSRELDGDVECARWGEWKPYGEAPNGSALCAEFRQHGVVRDDVPFYTSSLDDAVSAMPKGLYWQVSWNGECSTWTAGLPPRAQRFARTPAAALTAANLRYRAADMTED